MARRIHNAITDVPGIRVGHAHDPQALTGVTVVLCEGPAGAGAVGGVDQRGGAPGTRETDPMQPVHLVQRVHAVVLSGGSAFGLDSASGAVRYLEERGVGFDVGVAKVPIVPAAILFDLGLGRADVRPDAAMGYAACLAATTGPVAEGCVGAGMGATVGKALGMQNAMKAGLGTASLRLGGGLVVGALAVVNAFGDVVDPETGRIVAGARSTRSRRARPGSPGYFADTLAILKKLAAKGPLLFGRSWRATRQNTVLGIVAVNADLTKEETIKMAQMAQDGLARCIRPAHTMGDGDTVFALATGGRRVDVNVAGAFAAEALAQAILRAVRRATPMGGLPATGEGS
jgi:L-aminopeptidase/D-esterase-like protein